MVKGSLPFLIKDKPKPKIGKSGEERRRKRMTFIAALDGYDGQILFSDNLESAGYAKKKVKKVELYDIPGHAFRFAIANATSEGNYADALQAELAASLLSVSACDFGKIHNALTSSLSAFYQEHVWPQSSGRPEMDYLVVVQAVDGSGYRTFHIAQTAVNLVSEFHKSIGAGAYLSDYLFPRMLTGEGADSLRKLFAVAVYVGSEVHENVEGCGEIDEIFVFLPSGDWDYLDREAIEAVGKIVEPLRQSSFAVFDLATDHVPTQEVLAQPEQCLEDVLLDVNWKLSEWFKKWEEEREKRHMFRPFLTNRKAV